MSHKEIHAVLTTNDSNAVRRLLDQIADSSDNSGEIPSILAQVYEEIKVKNVHLSEKVDYFVISRLVETNFFEPKSNKTLQVTNLNEENAKARIEIIIECGLFLINNYFDRNMDDNFAQRIRIITQHTSVLKKFLKTSYDKLPWEEMEFCLLILLKFISREDDLVDIYKLVLDKDRVLNYLASFIEILSDISAELKKNDVNTKSRLPSRDTLIKSVISNNPTFEGLYYDYEIIRDIYTLNRIIYYIKQALDAYSLPNEHLRNLVIQRTLQVIGECLKNSTESPNLSNTVHNQLVYATQPVDLKSVITSVRDILSHAHSLSRRFITEKTQKNLFNELFDNLKSIQREANILLNRRKIQAFSVVLNKIKQCHSIEDAKCLLSSICFTHLPFCKLDHRDLTISHEVSKIERLVTVLKSQISHKTPEEKELLKIIESNLLGQEQKSENANNTFEHFWKLVLKSVSWMEHSDNLSHIKRFITDMNRGNKVFAGETRNHVTYMHYCLIELANSIRSRNANTEEIQYAIGGLFNIFDRLSNQAKKIRDFKSNIDEDEGQLHPGDAMIIDDIVESILKLDVSEDVRVKIEKGYQDNKLIPQLKIKMFTRLDEIKKDKFYSITDDDINKWKDLIKGLNINKRQTEESLMLQYKNKDVKGCENLIKLVNDNYSTLLKSFNDHNIFINNKQQTALKNFLTSLKLKKKEIEDVMNKFIDYLQNKIKTYFTERFNILRETVNYDSENEEIVEKYLKDELLQVIIEALILDLLEILEDMSFFCDNRLFVDDYTPVLIGKSLRNYLAHGNVFIDHLPVKSSIIILCNALTIVKSSGNLIDMTNLLIGKNIFHDDNFVKNRNFQSLKYIEVQLEMFSCAARNDIENIKECIGEGADIFGRTSDGRNALHFAAEKDSLDSFKFFLDQGLDLHLRNSEGFQPLHSAAIHGSRKIINYFLMYRLPLEVVNDGTTIVHLVARHGHLEILQKLVNKNFDTNIKNIHKLTPLHMSSEHGHVDIVKYLLSHGANICDETEDSFTALHYASRNGHNEIVELLLNCSENKEIINKKLRNGNTPLHLAVENCYINVVKSLLNHGSDPLIENEMNNTPLSTSIPFGNFDIFEMLYNSVLSAAGTIDNTELLLMACQFGKTSIAKFLIENGSSPNEVLLSGDSFLIIAVINNQEDSVGTLLSLGADVNTKNHNHVTPLHGAAEFGCVNIVNKLLSAGAKVNCLNNNGMSPLCIAAKFGQSEIVDILLDNKADINLTGMRKITPLHAAVDSGNRDIVNTLLEKGALVNFRTNKGVAPLHLAAKLGFNDITSDLLKSEADVDITTEYNYTPLHIACTYGHKLVITTLLKNDANINARTIKSFKSEMDLDEDEASPGNFSHAWSTAGTIMNKEDLTPLHLAVLNGNYDIVVLLLNKNAHLDINDNPSPLILAPKAGEAKIVNLLLSRASNIDMTRKISAFMTAVYSDHKTTLETLIKAGVPVNTVFANGETALHFAILFECNMSLSTLLDNGADPNCQNNEMYTPLHLAVKAGNKNAVALLVNKQADVNAQLSDGVTPLDFAIYNKDTEIVKMLCNAGACVNPIRNCMNNVQEQLQVENEIEDTVSFTPLLGAIFEDSYEIVGELLSFGADPNISDGDGSFPLIEACSRHQTAIVQKLIEFEADLEVISDEKLTPLFVAIQQNHLKILKVLLKAGAKVNSENFEGLTPLYMAVLNNNKDIVEELLRYRANINQPFNGITPLYIACEHGFVDIVKMLLKNDADINIATVQLWTPLHVVASNNFKEIASFLLDKDADCEKKTINGATPLHLAVENASFSVVEELLSRGSNIDTFYNLKNPTALFIASSRGYLELVEILLHYRANLNILNEDSLTALHVAILKEHPNIVKKLLKAGADPNVATNPGLKPLYAAIIVFSKEIICDLLVHGAIIDEQSEALMEKQLEKVSRSAFS